MKEVSLEIAKLLREKDISLNAAKGYYQYKDEVLCLWNVKDESGDFIAEAPLQTDLRDVLIEKYNIDIVIEPERYSDGVNYAVQAQRFDLVNGGRIDNFIVDASYWFNDNGDFPTFKLALDKGLLEGLKLIKEK